MTPHFIELSQKIDHLKSLSKNNDCLECYLMRGYALKEFQYLNQKTNQISKIAKINQLQIPAEMLQEAQRSISMVGLYLNV